MIYTQKDMLSSKYKDFNDFKNKLKFAVEPIINKEYWSDKKTKKSFQSFKLSCSSLTQILDNISAIDENLKKIRSLEKLDKEGLKENKSAIKFSDKLNSIESKLYFERAKQVESFYKQLELCKNQLISLKNRIEKESAKDDIKAITENFNYISYNALSLGTDIHIKLPKLSEIIARERNIEHRNHLDTEKKVEEVSSIGFGSIDGYEQALTRLNTTLMVSEDVLVDEIKKETCEIKTVLSPRVISVSKSVLNRLRNSSQLKLDLEQINNVFDTIYGFTASKGNLRKIDDELKALAPILRKAIKEEEIRNAELSSKQSSIVNQFESAKNAVNYYKSSLDKNSSITREQEKISTNTHELNVENRKLLEDAIRAEEDSKKADKFFRENFRPEPFDISARAEQLREESRQYYNQIAENEKKLDAIKDIKTAKSLPDSYKRMKKKLEEMSSLTRLDFKYAKYSLGGKSI